jgi:hypothetical protein
MLPLLASALAIANPAARVPEFPITSFAVERPFRARPGIRLPVIDYTAPDQVPRRASGIIAGVALTPSTTFGVGFFNIRRAKSGLAVDPRTDGATRRSRKAAVGITVHF